jgi:hypothetical protein
VTESLWCTTLPTLQRAWDATSLNALMFCPRSYQYSILGGWRQEDNEHLEFGAFFATAVEIYKKARLKGDDKEQGTLKAVRYAIERTWDRATGPWSGSYETAWRCVGDKPFKNEKGNKAKCPNSRAHLWFTGEGPDVCGSCGGTTETKRQWVTARGKDRYNLVRLVCAYCDNQPDNASDGPFPIAFPDGTPAVELSFQVPLPYQTPDKDPFLLCGHMDSIMAFGGENFVDDNKTTGKTLNKKYWASFSPNTQVDTYDLCGNVLWPELQLKGMLIEGAQITKTQGVKMGYGIMRRTEAQREEWLKEIGYWLSEAEMFAKENYWPMNRRNCWLCQFAEVCAKDPDKREMYLHEAFVQKQWNPLEER